MRAINALSAVFLLASAGAASAETAIPDALLVEELPRDDDDNHRRSLGQALYVGLSSWLRTEGPPFDSRGRTHHSDGRTTVDPCSAASSYTTG